MKEFYLGFDIGGTKCTAILGFPDERGAAVPYSREVWPTAEGGGPDGCISIFCDTARRLMKQAGVGDGVPAGIGIVCGSPLDPVQGVILSPPNLPGWDNVHIVEELQRQFPGCPRVVLENDANADAMAEWRCGAGVGTKNMVFITFGTGCGAGLILDGRLYTGTNDYAGECGHIRIAPLGPVGYGKAGSMEGFCSGGGIAQLGMMRVREKVQMGEAVPWYNPDKPLTAKDIAIAAQDGDPLARAIYAECGARLGEGLAVIADLLNPEAIVIGSIFQRSEELIRPAMEESFKREALPYTAKVCRVLPAKLGDNLGEYAALAMAQPPTC